MRTRVTAIRGRAMGTRAPGHREPAPQLGLVQQMVKGQGALYLEPEAQRAEDQGQAVIALRSRIAVIV